MKNETQIEIADPEQLELEAMEESYAQESQAVVKDRYCEWYMGKLVEFSALDKKLDEQYYRMKREINNRRNALSFACGEEFKTRIDAMIEAGPRRKDGTLKKKSVNLLTGTAGYRTQKEKVEFTHLPTAVKWALENLTVEQLIKAIGKIDKTAPVVRYLKSCKDNKEVSESITALNKTPFLEAIKNDGEMPDGVDLIPAEERFYPEIKRKELTSKDLHLSGTDKNGK